MGEGKPANPAIALRSSLIDGVRLYTPAVKPQELEGGDCSGSALAIVWREQTGGGPEMVHHF
jgi:hypothetical protein